MTTETHIHYIVQVKVKAEPMRDRPSGFGMFMPARWEWLSVDSDYASHTQTKSRAHRFPEVPTAEQIEAWSGMPRDCQHDRRYKPMIFKVTETRTQEQV